MRGLVKHNRGLRAFIVINLRTQGVTPGLLSSVESARENIIRIFIIILRSAF